MAVSTPEATLVPAAPAGNPNGHATPSAVIWRCPLCKGPLSERSEFARCLGCGEEFPCLGGILDLRVPGACWIDYDQDRDQARRLLAMSRDASAAELVRHVFSARKEWDAARVDLRSRQVLAAPQRLREDLRGWLRETAQSGTFLDLGCGPGMLIAAAAREGYRAIGLDVSLTWLVVAKKLITEWGGEPVLAAGLAEHLPLADESLAGVVSLDVIEHVADPTVYLREIDRVIAPGGRVALSTPNRFSVTPEPHVNVWGVGWLPRALQSRYVQWRIGAPYTFTRLLSAREAARLVRRNTRLAPSIVAPPIPDEEISRFSPRKALAARQYNRLTRTRALQRVTRILGPYFRVVAVKSR